ATMQAHVCEFYCYARSTEQAGQGGRRPECTGAAGRQRPTCQSCLSRVSVYGVAAASARRRAAVRGTRAVDSDCSLVNYSAVDRTAAWLPGDRVASATGATLVLLAATGLAIAALNRLLRRVVGPLSARLHLPSDTVLILTRLVAGCLWLIAALLVLDVWG